MAIFKHSKFNPSYETFTLIRKEILPTGKGVAFGISMPTLSVLQADPYQEDIDFDALSDTLLENIRDSEQHRAFEYHSGQFVEVDSASQGWFNF